MPKGTTAQRREVDKQAGGGTMSGSGVTCPCCGTIMTSENLRLESQAGRLGKIITTVVMDGPHGKEYRLPTEEEIQLTLEAERELPSIFADIPFGLPEEAIPQGASRSGGGSSFTVFLYGLKRWSDLFTSRQLLALGTFIKYTRAVKDIMLQQGYSSKWVEAISAYLAIAIDRLADRGSTLCTWTVGWDKIRNTFTRYALSMTWDFAESVLSANSSGGYPGAIEWVAMYIEHGLLSSSSSPSPEVLQSSAVTPSEYLFDAIVTDPPYYDAISYKVM